MRPIRLELVGFGTFRSRTVVEFDDLDLVAIVGPTGSGKSTVIDAVTFALYGSVARYDNTSLVAPVIHQLATEAKVRFDFELAGRRYRAVRVVRRVKSTKSGGARATTKEARLELDEGDAGTTVLAGNVSELDEQVQQLIGLDFRQFTRTIVLPQGAFAEFLTDDPGNRQKLLRRLLDVDIYARMGARARERASAATQQLEVYRHELARLDGVTDEALADASATSASLGAFAEVVAEQLGRLATIDTELDGHRTRVVELDRLMANLAGIEVPDEMAAAGSTLAQATAQGERAEQALADARRERDDADDALVDTGDPAEVQDQLRSRRQLAEAVTAHDGLVAEQARAEADLQACGTRSAEAEAAVSGAEEHLAVTRTAADAEVWIQRLEVGADCPICGQTVSTVPPHVDPHGLAEAEQAVQLARNEARSAATAMARAEGTVRSLQADVAQRHKLVTELTAAVEGVAEIAELVRRAEAAAAAGKRVRAAALAVREAEADLAGATSALDRARGAEQRLRGRFVAQRDTVADLGPPQPEDQPLAEEWAALTSWAAERTRTLGAERAVAAERGKALAGDKAELLGALAAAGADLGVNAAADSLVAAVAAARATADAAIARLTEQLAHKAELAAKVGRLAEQQSIDEALGRQHLSANGFERWLLAEALDDIVARATARLFELSSGRYSLEAVDGSFAVRDHGNADERRDVRTLSGGEVFLASLSLALALADSIAELAPVDAPRLESIFLDEGFGTLDADTLDVLAAAIEELSASGRLVIIVTHVRDLADRMPVRFEVRKDPTGSTIERSVT